MLQLSVKSNIKDVTRRLNDIQRKHIPFATAKALTNTAQEVKKAEVQEMKRVFDRPTKWTLNSVYVKPATKHKLIAVVWLKDQAFKGTPAGKYLMPHIKGGSRDYKRSERHIGKKYLAPGAGAKLNQYGNITKGQITKALANIKALPDPHQRTRKGGRGYAKRRYFYARIRGTEAIWVRQSKRKIRPYLVVIKSPRYRKRFDFFGVAQRTTSKVFPDKFEQALAYALATAK